MPISLGQRMVPEQRMHTVTIEEILSLGERSGEERPQLEHYFSPSRKEKFIKDYLHYLNSRLLDARHGNLGPDMYLLLVLSFQFITPLLKVPAATELEIFLEILERRYELDDPDINIRFTVEEDGEGAVSEEELLSEDRLVSGNELVTEEEAISSFRNELEDSFEGRRDVKESVQKRLKQDGIASIMKWQQIKGIRELAEAFGRCIVIPVLFSFTDRKLVGFYRQTTQGIRYEVEIPEFGELR